MHLKKKFRLILALIILCAVSISFIIFFPRIWGEAVYPLGFKDEILSASQEFGVDPDLIAAIIYSESRFNPKAGSHAGAKGLMQLICGTALGVARQIDLDGFTCEKIYDPKINIRLGTAYIKSQLDKYSGDVGAALAHYNGGPRAGGNYVAGRRDLMPTETQNYTRNVQNVRQVYRELYGADLSGAPKSFSPSQVQPSFSEIFKIDNIYKLLLGQY